MASQSGKWSTVEARLNLGGDSGKFLIGEVLITNNLTVDLLHVGVLHPQETVIEMIGYWVS